MKVKLRKKWNDSENNVLELFIVLLPVILSLPKGLHFEEVRSIMPVLENMPVNWLTIYDIVEMPVINILYPLQYIAILIWGALPLHFFNNLQGEMIGSSLLLLAIWYKVLEVFLQFEILVYLKKTIEIYRKRKISDAEYLVYTIPIFIYNLAWQGSWNVVIMLFLIMGIYNCLRGQMVSFVLCFLFGMLCHPAVLFFYIPLVLRKRKKLKTISNYLICLLLPFFVEFVIFSSSEGFRSLVLRSINQKGWLDIVIWIVCLILSILTFFDKQMKSERLMLVSCIIISLILWLINEMRVAHWFLLAIIWFQMCVLNSAKKK